MLFKTKGRRLQGDEMTQSTPDVELTEPTEPTEPTDFVYPSGFKLALLMISIFIGMFLVALVCSNSIFFQEHIYVHAS